MGNRVRDGHRLDDRTRRGNAPPMLTLHRSRSGFGFGSARGHFQAAGFLPYTGFTRVRRLSVGMDSAEGLGVVSSLVGQDKTRCSDCGDVVDLSDSDSIMTVLATLERHRKTRH